MTLEQKIAEAETALHKLSTGSLRETVEFEGQRVTFAATDVTKLSGYLDQLKAQLAGQQTRGAVGFIF